MIRNKLFTFIFICFPYVTHKFPHRLFKYSRGLVLNAHDLMQFSDHVQKYQLALVNLVFHLGNFCSKCIQLFCVVQKVHIIHVLTNNIQRLNDTIAFHNNLIVFWLIDCCVYTVQRGFNSLANFCKNIVDNSLEFIIHI